MQPFLACHATHRNNKSPQKQKKEYIPTPRGTIVVRQQQYNSAAGKAVPPLGKTPSLTTKINQKAIFSFRTASLSSLLLSPHLSTFSRVHHHTPVACCRHRKNALSLYKPIASHHPESLDPRPHEPFARERSLYRHPWRG